jgi:hypothetical protein
MTPDLSTLRQAATAAKAADAKAERIANLSDDDGFTAQSYADAIACARACRAKLRDVCSPDVVLSLLSAVEDKATSLQPVRWALNPEADHNQRHHIEQREQRDGSVRYVIAAPFSEVMNRKGYWEWEPQPSSRTDEFIKATRFATLDEAVAVYRASLTPTASRHER